MSFSVVLNKVKVPFPHRDASVVVGSPGMVKLVATIVPRFVVPHTFCASTKYVFDVPTSFDAKDAVSSLEPNEGLEMPDEIAVPFVETVYQRMLCALMLVADADKTTLPEPQRPSSVKVSNGSAASHTETTELRFVVPHAFSAST
jgi:hypothetical protein